MIKKFAIGAALAIASFTAGATDVAVEDTPYRFYAGVDGGTTQFELPSSRHTSVGALAGYRFSPYIAVEAGARHLYRKGPRLTGDTDRSELDQFAVSAVGTMALPVNYDIAVYGRLGVNRLNLSVRPYGTDGVHREHETRGLYGIGIAAAPGPGLSARVELQKPSGKLTNLSLSMFLKF